MMSRESEPIMQSSGRLWRVEQLQVYQLAFASAMEIFHTSALWPREERYALTDQVRRSSRAVCANLSEAWAKRRYPNHFVSKLTDAHGEAEETLTWIRFAVRCDYWPEPDAHAIAGQYRRVIGGLVRMMKHPQKWCGPGKASKG